MLQKLIEIIENPAKAAYTVVAGTATGYAPKVVNAIDQSSSSNIDTYFQYGVWAITIMVGIAALISFVQKQIDRRRERRKNKYTKIE